MQRARSLTVLYVMMFPGTWQLPSTGQDEAKMPVVKRKLYVATPVNISKGRALR